MVGAREEHELRALRPKELVILQLIAEGKMNCEIATELNYSLDTIKDHVKEILYSLGADNRAHAVGLAFRAGILS